MSVRLFLTKNESWKKYIIEGESITKGFLSKDENRLVTVKITKVIEVPVKAEINICNSLSFQDYKRFNFLISIEEAEDLLKMCLDPIVSYKRYLFGIRSSAYSSDTQVWFIKVYEGIYSGFITTGIRLRDATEVLYPPEWVGAEVTDDKKYQDYNLAALAV